MSAMVSVPLDEGSDPITVIADGWFPPVDVREMRAAFRLPDTITDPRLVAAIEGGMVAAMRDLADWRSGHASEGVERMADVDPTSLNGGNRLEKLFVRAVTHHAAADILDTYRDFSATAEGVDRAEERAANAADYRRQALLAVRDILGVTRTVVELI